MNLSSKGTRNTDVHKQAGLHTNRRNCGKALSWIPWLWTCSFYDCVLIVFLSQCAELSYLTVQRFSSCYVTAHLYHSCCGLRNACFPHQLSQLYSEAGGENTCLRALCHGVSCLPILRCHSSLLPHNNTSGSIFVSISCRITAATQETIWHHVGLKQASSLWWCRSPLLAIICPTLYSPMLDEGLKSIMSTAEMCFPEHQNITLKPRASARGGTKKKQPARWHCCHTTDCSTIWHGKNTVKGCAIIIIKIQ